VALLALAIIGFPLAALAIWYLGEATRLRFSKQQAERRDLWRRTARLAELTKVEEAADGLRGRKGRFTVRLEPWSNQDGGGTCLVISGLRSGRDVGLSLRAERLGARGAAPGEIELGDQGFDDVVSVQGSPAVARAVLDAATRRAVAGLVQGSMPVPGRTPLRISGELGDGELRLLVPEATVLRIYNTQDQPVELLRGFLSPEERLPEVLRFALDLASRVDDTGDLAARIAANTVEEPDPHVRETNLLALIREFPDSPATRQALIDAVQDPDAVVRLQAAIAVRHLGELGLDEQLVRLSRDTLRGIALGGGAEDATSARALEALGTGLSVEEARDILREALRTRRMATAAASMGILGALGGEHAVRMLAKVLGVEKDEMAAAAADALARTKDPSAEGALLRALSQGPRSTKVSAARALGRLGTASCVAPLREAESAGGELRRAARQAIAEIQSRLAEAAGAAPGQLSLADGQAGEVSLVEEDVAGRLTLAEPQKAEATSSTAGDGHGSPRPVPRATSE